MNKGNPISTPSTVERGASNSLRMRNARTDELLRAYSDGRRDGERWAMTYGSATLWNGIRSYRDARTEEEADEAIDTIRRSIAAPLEHLEDRLARFLCDEAVEPWPEMRPRYVPQARRILAALSA